MGIKQILFTLVIVFMSFMALNNFSSEAKEETSSRIEEAIRAAAIQCYAIEGAYPSLDYLVEHYGLVLNNDKFYYHYEMVASNIVPIIRVIEKRYE